MQDKVVTRNGIKGLQTTTNGVPGPITVQSQILQTEIFTVLVGGNTHGNHRSPNANSYTKRRITYGNGKTFSGDAKNNSQTWGCQAGEPSSSGLTALESKRTMAYNAALEELSSQTRGTLDLSVSMFEASQVERMVRNVFKLRDFVQRFKPRNWSKNWLEYQYGWRPLVDDIYETAKTFSKPAKEGVVKFDVRRSLSSNRTRTINVQGPKDNHIWQQSRTDRVQLVVRLNMRNDTLTRLSQISSLNPASIMWELTPYSFVADWVIDIGGYLRMMETACLNDLVFMDGFLTYTSRWVDEGRHAGYVDLGGGSYSTFDGSYVETNIQKIRGVLSGYPRPVFPSVKVDLGAERIISAASLLQQRLRF